MIKKYKGAIIAQKFIKEIDKGDRRIILIDGDYVGSVARIPKKGSIKANFHAGGSAQKTGLVFKDRKISSENTFNGKISKIDIKKLNFFII